MLKDISAVLEGAMEDACRADCGNQAAGTRVRKAAMQAVKDLKVLRTAIQDKKNAPPGAPGGDR